MRPFPPLSWKPRVWAARPAKAPTQLEAKSVGGQASQGLPSSEQAVSTGILYCSVRF